MSMTSTLTGSGWLCNMNQTEPTAAPVYTWATRPAAAGRTGAQIRISDVGGGNPTTGEGTVFVSDGKRWKPLNKETLLDAIDTANAGTAVATEQQLNPNHAPLPAGLLGDFDRLMVQLSVSKNGATDGVTLRLRFGPLGTVADPVIATIAVAAANQSYGTVMTFKRLSATTLEQEGNGDPSASFNGPSTLAAPSAVVVSSMDVNTMYMSVTAQMGTGAEIPTVRDYTMRMVASEP